MPKAAPRTTNRSEPYTKSPPKRGDTTANPDKEKINPSANTPKKPTPNKQSASEPDNRGDYRDIPLDEYKDEVPCYDNATAVRRKLKKLLSDKSQIPGTSKKWSQASMAAEMQELEKRGHKVPYNRNATGPTARSLGNFLKQSGQMRGGDSPCYYWGYILLEKLRIHKGEKKSKAREKAEEEFPGGHVREDHTKRRITMHRDPSDPPGAWDPESRAGQAALEMPPLPAILEPLTRQPPPVSAPGGTLPTQPPPGPMNPSLKPPTPPPHPTAMMPTPQPPPPTAYPYPYPPPQPPLSAQNPPPQMPFINYVP